MKKWYNKWWGKIIRIPSALAWIIILTIVIFLYSTLVIINDLILEDWD